jgi:hypothetical protein
VTEVYGSLRSRATKAEVEGRRAALYDIAEEMEPISVRGVYYQATVRGLVEKTELGYRQVQHDLTVMRRAGDLPYGWLADGPAGSASRRRSTASMMLSGRRRGFTATRCGPTRMPTSRSGWRRMPSQASSIRSPQ